jgi:hypothetical protein
MQINVRVRCPLRDAEKDVGGALVACAQNSTTLKRYTVTDRSRKNRFYGLRESVTSKQILWASKTP